MLFVDELLGLGRCAFIDIDHRHQPFAAGRVDAGLPWLATPMTTVPSFELGDFSDSTAGAAKAFAPAAAPATAAALARNLRRVTCWLMEYPLTKRGGRKVGGQTSIITGRAG